MFKKKVSTINGELANNQIPNHIAIIMDGNGRWAQKRHLPRIAGHKRGMETVKVITKAASMLGVKVLTLYAFSTENWRRPESEVSYLMKLPGLFFDQFVPELIQNNVSVNVIGELQQLPLATQRVVQRAIQATADCNGMVLNFALNYGSRTEIVLAVRKIAQAVQKGEMAVDEINSQLFARSLMTGSLGANGDPDLLIRTSGEQRLSNFLLWQLAYSELVFTDELWPDFTANSLRQAILEFQKRDRRFGGVKTNQ